MGYSLTIGEHTTETEDGETWDAAITVTHDDAPAFGEPTDYTNTRWPSYSSWSWAVEFLGIDDMFTGPGSLMPSHPGCAPITREAVNKLKARRKIFEARHPSVTASYDTGRDEDMAYCRIVWLDYWMSWALENCKKPVFHNT